MKANYLLTVFFSICIVASAQIKTSNGKTITAGQMPNITRDKSGTIHMVYGKGDSIMYISTADGNLFSSPSLIAVLPGLYASAMRGPQIAAADNSLIVTACTKQGNIFSYQKSSSGKWAKPLRVNDASEQAKEALMALNADGLHLYAVWLGVNGAKGQAVYGAGSVDGGKTWNKNIQVYASPGGSVCECCKPSLSVKGDSIYVMFRNLIEGNRDLYLIKSANGGKSFGKALKIGNGNWKLNGCPMDGGGLTVEKNGNVETVWRREGKIFTASPGKPEKEIGQGRNCAIECINYTCIYAWSENGNVMVMKPDGTKINMGMGGLPLIKAMNDEQLICVWENEKQIMGSVLKL